LPAFSIVEIYSKNGKRNLGGFDPMMGEKLKIGISGRKGVRS